MVELNQKVDLYISDGCGRCGYYATDKCKVRTWQLELEHARQIVLESKLVEEVKWGVPVYTLMGKNVIALSALKDCVTLGFFKGVLLKDPYKILEKQGKSMQSNRIIRFRSVQEITDKISILKEYINEAISVEESGAKVQFKKDLEPIPEELLEKFEEFPPLKTAFYALTPGKQRGYIIYFSQPKQSQSKISRIEKSMEKILNGEGMYDKYKSK